MKKHISNAEDCVTLLTKDRIVNGEKIPCGSFFCEICEQGYLMNMPVHPSIFLGAGEAFIKLHYRCFERREANEAEITATKENEESPLST